MKRDLSGIFTDTARYRAVLFVAGVIAFIIWCWLDFGRDRYVPVSAGDSVYVLDRRSGRMWCTNGYTWIPVSNTDGGLGGLSVAVSPGKGVIGK